VAPVRKRRTQAERTAATRALLLDATVECLSKLGYARTTTVEIARRAGVSRGAQLHHFPAKVDLVTTAVEHLFGKLEREFRERISGLEKDNVAVAAIDLLWMQVSGSLFGAWLELLVAARTDARLRRRVAAMGKRFAATIEANFRQLFPAPDEPNPLFDVVPAFSFALCEGLALERIAIGDTDRIRSVLSALKQLSGLVLPGVPL
jgi:AcrR family transcriptional regulator